MDIIPPRRRGQLGAFSVGVGTQSGGFKVSPSASPSAKSKAPAPPPSRSMSMEMATRAPSAPLRPGPALSISEQVEAERKSLAASTSAKAARQVTPQFSKGDNFQNSAVVAVQGYRPPAATPQVTQPAKQPNENAAVTAAANQQPQTRGQVIQQVLARDGGVLVSSGNLPAVPPAPGQPGNELAMSALADLQPLSLAEATLIKRITSPELRPDRRSKPIPGALPQWLRDWRKGVAAKELESQIKPIAYDDGVVVVELRTFLKTAPRPSDQPIPVGATSRPPPLPQPAPPQPAPALSPAVAETAAKASGAIVGAKIAVAQAKNLELMKAKIEASKKVLEEKKKIAEAKKKEAEEAAKAASEKEKKSIVEADAIIKNQTATDGDKTEMEAKVRAAAEEKARAEKAAAAAAAEAARLAAEKEAAEKASADLAKAADVAKAAAEAKIEDANKKIEVAQTVEKEISIQRATMAKPTIELPDSAVSSKNLVVIDQPKADDKKGGMMPVLLGLVAVGAVAYAVHAKKQNLGAPLIAELEED